MSSWGLDFDDPEAWRNYDGVFDTSSGTWWQHKEHDMPEDPEYHLEDNHIMWTPPSRCITCGGHRVSRVKGCRPIRTRRLGILAIIAELPMRWLARSLAKKDSRTWTMDEQIPPLQFGTHIHEQLEHYYRELGNVNDELGPE